MTPVLRQFADELRALECHLRARARVIETDPAMRRADQSSSRMAALELHYAADALETAAFTAAAHRLDTAIDLLRDTQERRSLATLGRLAGTVAEPIGAAA